MDRPALNDNRGGDAVPRDQDGHLRRRRRNPAANKPGMPPHFWDRLNRVHLTRSALREVDRRNKLHPPPQASSSSFPPTLTLDRFARLGGPNLSHLLNFSESKLVHGIGSQVYTSSGIGKMTKLPSACDANFASYLRIHSIYTNSMAPLLPSDLREPINLEELETMLEKERESDSDLQGDEVRKTFESFYKARNKAQTELEVIREVIHWIIGAPNHDNIPHGQNTLFTNLDSLTCGETAAPKPDWFDGQDPSAVDQNVKRMIEHRIVPTKKMEGLICHNFFLEYKAKKGSTETLEYQACNDGVHGAAGMEAIRMIDPTQVKNDGHAYTISATFHQTVGLNLYSHHIVPPRTPETNPTHVMYELATYSMKNAKNFIQGVKALRNARDHCQKVRDDIARMANALVATSAVEPGTAAGPSSTSGQLAPSAPLPYLEGGDGSRNSKRTRSEADIGEEGQDRPVTRQRSEKE